MEQMLLNDIISTSIGGAAGGAVAGIVVMAIQGAKSVWLDRRHANRAFKWLSEETRGKNQPFRSTSAISRYTNLTQDRVNFVCSQDPRIELRIIDDREVWGVRP